MGIEEIQHISACPGAKLRRDRHPLSQPEKVILGDRTRTQDTVDGAETTSDAEGAGRLLLYHQIDVHPILSRAPARLNLDLLEIAEIGQILTTARQETAIVQVALVQRDLPSDNFVTSLRVARDLDSFQEGLLPFTDIQSHIDNMALPIGIDGRGDIRKEIAALRIPVCQRQYVPLEHLPAENALSGDLKRFQHRLSRKDRIARNSQLPDPILRAFFHPDTD